MIATRLYLQAAEELDRLEVEMKALSAVTPDGWRKAYIGLRKRLQDQIFALHPSNHELTEVSPADIRRLHAVYADLRACAASHQANWPVVRIDGGDPDYRTSVLALRRASDLFLDVVRDLVRGSSTPTPYKL